MIASLNIVAKTFAKIAKTFIGLSVTIMATKRRHVLILHLEAKYAKMDYKNGIYTKTGQGELVLQKSTLKKVNGQQESQSQRSTPCDDISNTT